jgi:hypothetical protein
VNASADSRHILSFYRNKLTEDEFVQSFPITGTHYLDLLMGHPESRQHQRCDNVLDNLSGLKAGKREIIHPTGIPDFSSFARGSDTAVSTAQYEIG